VQSAQTRTTPYGEAIDLTLNRCIQEGITNAIRHRKADHLTVDLVEEPATRRNGSKRGPAQLRLTVSDDGKGIAPSTPKGFGLTTMTERVRSLGGTCVVESTPPNGTSIRIEIPVQGAGCAKRARAPELVAGLS
jgi:two-component system sensor histidine kinase UhpB